MSYAKRGHSGARRAACALLGLMCLGAAGPAGAAPSGPVAADGAMSITLAPADPGNIVSFCAQLGHPQPEMALVDGWCAMRSPGTTACVVVALFPASNPDRVANSWLGEAVRFCYMGNEQAAGTPRAGKTARNGDEVEI